MCIYTLITNVTKDDGAVVHPENPFMSAYSPSSRITATPPPPSSILTVSIITDAHLVADGIWLSGEI